ncbi:hypothetical protein AKJ09_01552 [Labilithrix luteola]|uniref:Uncharacterized protein n=1 Tax=Labilithrix luteola TaxID=1391654 RepID=A0A0K1PMY3_9BACT|nr:hypothetical protein AKJ09_01552 [Labilithrix luteola]
MVVDGALRVDARRAKVTTLIARLHVRRWSQGPAACAELLEQTKELVDEGDVAFRAELLGFETLVGRTLGDGARYTRALESLRALVRANEHYRARATLEQHDTAPARLRAFPDDELTPLFHSVVSRDVRVLQRLLGLGLLGPVPELLGLTPAKRIIFLTTENAALLEDNGNLHFKPSPPRWCATLLRVLSHGPVSKERIVASLWGLRAYRPERHDPLVRTTIHRLRAFLAPHGDWAFVDDTGPTAAACRSTSSEWRSRPISMRPSWKERRPTSTSMIPSNTRPSPPSSRAATNGKRRSNGCTRG